MSNYGTRIAVGALVIFYILTVLSGTLGAGTKQALSLLVFFAIIGMLIKDYLANR